ncbi:MAG: apolipoprotein N-acyltransferase [Pseudomonadota bacterium]|nr:apolipoprotein N-acyltransferase [Pseudomonadota bacterium]
MHLSKPALLIGRLTGWRRALAAFIAGALSVLALAPFFLWPICFVTLPLLVWLIDGAAALPARAARLRAAALTGWFFSFGYLLAGLYWIGFSFLVEADKFAWLLPFAVTLLPAGLALYFAVACAAAAALWRPGVARLLTLAVLLTLAEYARGHLFTGLPWNLVGYWVTAGDAMMQWAALFGVYVLALFAIHIFSVPALFFCAPHWQEIRAPVRILYVAAAGLMLGAASLYGHARLSAPPTHDVAGVRLRIVQPNIPQTEKWLPQNRAAVFRRYLEVSRSGADGTAPDLSTVTHLVWPESALPFLLQDTNEALAAIAELLPEGTVLLNGQARAEDRVRPDNTLAGLRVWNSLFVMDSAGRILSIYDKLHLVPFGEYLPFQRWLEAIGLRQLTRVRGGFESGMGRRYLEAPGVPPFVPLICYEVIFPGDVVAPRTRPQWMLNVTNDAWFGRSTGPYQHLHQTRLRAVEQGLPVIRAANTGVSAVIDAHGRVLSSLGLGRAGIIDTHLPGAAPSTLYAQLGNVILVAALFVYGLLAAVAYFFSPPRTTPGS